MAEFHEELVKDWTVEQLEVYIGELKKRAVDLDNWIKYLKNLKKKKVRSKPVFDNGVRGGA